MDVVNASSSLSFSITQISSLFGSVTVTVPKEYVQKLYTLASEEQIQESRVLGFSRGNAPLSYIEQNYQPHLLEHVKEFLFKYFVINCLYQQLEAKKIFFSEEPRLTDITITPHSDACFTFSITLAQPLLLQGWKRLPFKAPKRKNYKDLDRQVEHFLKEEADAEKKTKSEEVGINDWIHFSVTLLDRFKEPLLGPLVEHLWLRIGPEEVDSSFQVLFLGKKIGDCFITDHAGLQEYFSTHIDTQYHFSVTILDHLPSSYFNLDHFKKHFRLKNSKEIHQKCIEVFSYRNDISQRRATSEDALGLLLSKQSFVVPQHLVLRQEKSLLEAIHEQPDYNVYKMQQDFREKIRQLAEKQIREHILVQQLAILEGISVTNADIKGYLNLLNRPRTAEFIYFQPPTTRFLGREMPVSSAILARTCLKEKTLNHLIYHFAKHKSGT